MLVLALAHQDPLTNIPLGKKKRKKHLQCWGGLYRQCKWTNVTFQPSYLLGSTRGCPPLSPCEPRATPVLSIIALQHLLKTKEGAVYTYFYSSIKRWPANKEKKNRAHLVLCAECPQVNRIRWAFSRHVKIRQKKKKRHWMCTLILHSRNRVLQHQRSEQFLTTTAFTFMPLTACRQHTGMEVWLFLWMAYPWNCHKKAGKGKGTADRSHFPCFPSDHSARSPKGMLSKCTDPTMS